MKPWQISSADKFTPFLDKSDLDLEFRISDLRISDFRMSLKEVNFSKEVIFVFFQAKKITLTGF